MDRKRKRVQIDDQMFNWVRKLAADIHQDNEIDPDQVIHESYELFMNIFEADDHVFNRRLEAQREFRVITQRRLNDDFNFILNGNN